MKKLVLKIIIINILILFTFGCANQQTIKSNDGYKNSNNEETIRLGEIMKIGIYNNDPIEWIVIDKNENDKTLFLLSKYAIDKHNYGSYSATWETSEIRGWLSNLYNIAFDEDEKQKIVYSNVDNSTTCSGAKSGNNTSDYIYLLSIDEFVKYSTYYSDYYNIDIALDQNNVKTWWWLRTPSAHHGVIAAVYSDFTYSIYGGTANNKAGIRPVMNIKY